MVDVSGVAQGQPNWAALGEAGRKFSHTVNGLYQETAAKYELLKYQQGFFLSLDNIHIATCDADGQRVITFH